MRDVLRATRAAVCGKCSVHEELLFFDPQIDHRLGTERAGGAAPDVFALKRLSGNIRRMLETSRRRQMICPSLGALREIDIPLKLRNARQDTLSVMTFKQPIVEVTKSRLHAREQKRGRDYKTDLARCFSRNSHGKSPSLGACLSAAVAKTA